MTTFKLQHEIDTGNILLQEKIEIGDNETAGELHDRMKEIGARLLVDTIKGLVEGTLQELPQENVQSINASDQSSNRRHPLTTHHSSTSLIKHALQDHHSDLSKLIWLKSADEIYNLIRGLSPYPAAFTELSDKTLKVFRSEKEHAPPYIKTTEDGKQIEKPI